MVKYTDEQITNILIEKLNGKKVYILAPLVKGRKGHYKELFEQLIKKGFLRARINGELKDLMPGMRLDSHNFV